MLLLKYWFAPEAEYIVTYDSVLISDNNVGHEWYIYVECDGERVRDGDSIIGKIEYDKELVVYAIEEDIYEDVGEEIVNIELGEHSLSKTIKVYPEENRGRYSGRQAEWEINLKIDFVKKMN